MGDMGTMGVDGLHCWQGTYAFVGPWFTLAMLVGDRRLTALAGEHSPSEWFAIGVYSLLVFQLTAYVLVWAAWWLRQR